jgi:PAS domain S-box-containing protein/putative nucleotidyltransferase with HDIG domain
MRQQKRWATEKQPAIFGRYEIIVIILLLFGLYLSSRYSYLLFHSLAELFAIVIALTIFVVAWNSRQFMSNNYLLFIGIAYGFAGVLDIVHTLAFRGMNIFKGYDANLPTQLWIVARYMQSLSLLIAPVFFKQKLKVSIVIPAYAVVTVLVLLSIFYWQNFPTCYIEGVGLTPFKKVSEYIICTILAGAVGTLYWRRKRFDTGVFRLLVISLIFAIASELMFTFYIDVYDISNLAGHLLRIVSFYLIYKAIVETGLMRPYQFLFRDLKQSEQKLSHQAAELTQANTNLEQEIELRRQSEQEERHIISTAMDGFWLTDTNGHFLDVNDAYCTMIGYSRDELLNMAISDVEALEKPEDTAKHMEKVIAVGYERFETCHRTKSGRILDIEVSVNYLDVKGGQFFVFLRDITERKRLECINAENAKLEVEVVERRRSEEALRHIAQEVAARTGEDFFRAVVQYLTSSLSMDYAFIGELVAGKEEKVRAWIVSVRGQIGESFEYNLANTPCQKVVGKKVCSYPSNIQQQFPQDRLLAEKGIESYAGIPVFASGGEQLGIMVVMHTKPLDNPSTVEAIMQIFATRVGAEMKRIQVEKQIRCRTEREQLLKNTAVAVNQASTLEEALQAVLDAVCHHTGFPVGHAYLKVEDSNKLASAKIWHLDNPAQFKAFRKVTGTYVFTPGVGLVGRAYSSKKPTWIVDVNKDPNFPRAKMGVDIGIKAGFAFPAIAGAEAVAIMEFFHPEAMEPDESLLDLLSQIGVQLGRAFEREHLEQEKRYNERRLTSLIRIANYQASDVTGLLDFAMNEALSLTRSKVGYIYFYDETDEKFILHSWSKEVMKECAIQKPETVYYLDKTGLWGEVVRQRKAILVNDFQSPHPLKKGYPEGHVILHRFLSVPVFVDERIVAVLGLANKDTDYDLIDVQQMTLLADAAWKIVDRRRIQDELAQSLERTQQALDGVVNATSLAMESRDPYTAGHQRRVAQLASAIAEEMGLSEDRITGLRMAATIHDIGKMSVPTEILSKPGKINEMEFGIIKAHTQTGYDILKDIEFPWPIAQVAYQHHERLDGSGYPQGLSAANIILEAKILAAADVVEAMASHRPYRPALGIDKALDEIAQKKGIIYDSQVVNACLKLFAENKFKFD